LDRAELLWSAASWLCFLTGTPVPLQIGIGTHEAMEETITGHHLQSEERMVLNRRGRMDRWV